MAKKHSKHAKLTLRKRGVFAPNELSFVGVKCSVITNLVNEICEKLSEKIKIGYVDASHSKDIEAPKLTTYTYHSSGNAAITSTINKNTFNDSIRFSQYDLMCVNGNHYPANEQVVFLDPEKEGSIEKRLEQLDAIQFFIKMTNDGEIFECLKNKYPSCVDLPMYHVEDLAAISAHIENRAQQNIPNLNGLVLVGGKSVRMGADKGLLDYHGLPQRDYTVRLLEDEGLKTFVSSRKDQDIDGENTITDAFVGLGPFGAICSAFMKNPNEAYLVLATDLPYVNKELIQLLLKNRNPKKIATAIKGKGMKFMEPLVTIWEPKSYPVLLSYLAQGYSCPRKILINSDVEIIEVEDVLIQNINTPEEFEKAKEELNK